MRLAFLVRPEHFKSAEDKNEKTRFTTSDEQISVFLHVSPENHIQMVRYKRGLMRSAFIEYFMDGLMPYLQDKEGEADKKRLEHLVETRDAAGLADYLIERLNPPVEPEYKTAAQVYTKRFQEAYMLGTVAEAKRYLTHVEAWYYHSPEIIRNVSKVVITSVLETTLASKLLKSVTMDGARDFLNKTAAQLLAINIPRYEGSGPGKDYISVKNSIGNAEAFVSQTITTILKVYKPHILGWNKK